MRKDKTKESVRLKEGSLYRITSMCSREKPMVSTGKFLGFTSVGTDEGLCIRLGSEHDELEGKVRVIPTHILLAIDLLEQEIDEEENPVDDERTALYFG